MDEGLFRDAFPIFRESTYLNTASLGPYSIWTDRRVQEFYREWSAMGAPAWYEIWWERLEETRAAFAKLIGADASEVAILPNVSSAINVLASALDYRERNKVVTSQIDFPTIPYAWMAKPKVKVVRVGQRGAHSVPVKAYVDALDKTVACVATSHVFYSTGAVQDVGGICAAARKAGALSIIDSYHGVGQLPVDVKELGCDALISGGLKWLLGGPGCALLYVRKGLHKSLSPTVTGWFANERQFDFDPAVFAFRSTGAKYELGTPSLPSTFATLGGMELVSEAGPRKVRRRQNELITDLYEKLVQRGYRIHGPDVERERAGILMVEVQDAPGAVAKLAEEKIIVDHRDGRVRVSPYFYNTIDDNDWFVDALARAAPPRRSPRKVSASR